MRAQRISVVVLGVVLVAAFGGVIVIGALNPAPDTSAIAHATAAPMVTTRVEERPVREPATLVAQLSEPESVQVNALAEASGADVLRQVVSRTFVEPGDEVRVGDLIAEVSGRPVFAFGPGAPLYRNLAEGSSGSDVTALQEMLVAAGHLRKPTGTFGPSTTAALRRLYARHGFASPHVAPGVPGMPLSDAAVLPLMAVQAVDRCPRGAVPGGDRPLLTVQTRAAVLTGRADVIQVGAFTPGGEIRVQVGSAAPVTSRVVAVSGFQEAGGGSPAGYDVTVAVPEGLGGDISGEPITLREAVTIPLAPAVPLESIRTDAYGVTHILIVDGAEIRPANVTVVNRVAGYAILGEGAPALGATVVVSGA